MYMKRLLTVALTLLLVGCTSTEPVDNVSYPIQTEENVQNSVQNSDSESDSVDAPIVEEVVEEEEQKSTESGTVLADTQDSAENDDLVDAPNVDESAQTRKNRWIEKCESYTYNSNKSWAGAYRQIIDDICSETKINPDVIDVIYGPNANPSDPLTVSYIETAIFAWSFWENYVPNPTKTTFIVVSPEDNVWWKQNATKYTSISQQELGSCAYFNENNFCSYKYLKAEGKTNIDGDIFLWVVKQDSPLKADTYIDPAHNAVHWFQDAYEFQHWYEFFIEGHATMYEIAFHILDSNRDNYREGYAWLSHTMDNIKFVAKTKEEVNAHFDRCYGRGYDCNHFYYGGGAMFHETLILNYGYDSYMQWNELLASIDTTSEFNDLFERKYLISIEKYQSSQFASYVAESFGHYYSLW